MEPSNSQKPQSEDSWELVSGSKSLTTETVQSLLQREDKEEDWYTTLPPATPANTPEYTATPPSYPSAALRKDLPRSESGDLFPIEESKEEVNAIEELKSEANESSVNSSVYGEDSVYFEYTPAESENEEPRLVTLKTIEGWIYRVAAYLIVFNIVKWVVLKIWSKLRGLRGVNE